MTVHSTIDGFIQFHLSVPFIRKYVNSCGETTAWWKNCEERYLLVTHCRITLPFHHVKKYSWGVQL